MIIRRAVIFLALLLPAVSSAERRGFAADARPDSPAAVSPERALQTEIEHRKLETLVREYDLLGQLSQDRYHPAHAFERRAAALKSIRQRLLLVNFGLLDNHDWVAFHLFRANLKFSIENAQSDMARNERLAALAPSSPILYKIRARLYDASDARSVLAAAMLAEIPGKIDALRENAAKVEGENLWLCRKWLERDVKALDEWYESHSATVPGFEKEYAEPCRRAKEAINAWREHLKKRVEKPPRVAGEDAGERAEKFAAMLRDSHMEFRDPDELLKIAREQFDCVRTEMEKLAREIAPDKTLRQVLDEMKEHHPRPEGIAPAYQQVLERARDFLLKKDIITIPEECRDNVRAERYLDKNERLPYALYDGGGDDMKYFRSSVPSTKADAAQIGEKMRDHNYYSMFTVTVHETFPGHHLQFAHMAMNIRVPQVAFYTSFFSEGWAVYTEEMMHEQGFFERAEQPKGWDLDPRKIRLHQLRWRLHRAARAIIDISCQTGDMSREDAVKLLTEEVGLENGSAKAEVNRFTNTPTQPMSYLVGYLGLMQLREDYRKMKGEKFNLKEFHDELLSYGSVPIILLRGVMLGERDRADKILEP